MSVFKNQDPQTELTSLFRDSADPARSAAAWAREVAADAGLDPAQDQVRLIRELRRTSPGLELAAATTIAKLASTGVDIG